MEYSNLLENKIKEITIFKTISEIAEKLKYPVWIVGGFVRDIILNRNTNDIDIVCVGNGIQLAEEVAKKIGKIKVYSYKNFGTASFNWNNYKIEFVGARKESYRANSRNPIVENGNFDDDQKRRDFTINTLAISLNKNDYGSLIDTFGGLNDLKNKVIKTPLDPAKTFSDDPLRMLRAIRFATQLNFTIEKNTYHAIIQMKERINIITKERITEELSKIIASDKPSIGFRLLHKTGLLEIIFPELNNLSGVEEIEGIKHKDNLEHTLQVLDKVSTKTENIWLRWAALLHDIGKPIAKKYNPEMGWTFHSHEVIGSKMIPELFRKLRLPLNENMRYVQKLVFLHLRPTALIQDNITDSAIRRLIVEAGEHLEDLLLLCEADITSKNQEKIKKHIENLKLLKEKIINVTELDRLRNWQPPISGEYIMQLFNLQPSRIVGELKNSVREAILNGEIPDEFEAAKKYLLKIAAEKNIYPIKN